MSDLDVPEPYTNRTAGDVYTDMRVGDVLRIDQDGRQLTVRVFKVDGGFNVHLGGTSYHWADAWAAEPGTVAIPRCLALDPQIGDTYQRDQHQEEVYAVDKHWVCTLDLYGATYKHTRKSWADGARTWTSCRDREGGAIDFLRPGGALVAIMSGNVPDARGRKASDFRYLVAKHGGHFEALPPSTFKESGTNVKTVLLTLFCRRFHARRRMRPGGAPFSKGGAAPSRRTTGRRCWGIAHPGSRRAWHSVPRPPATISVSSSASTLPDLGPPWYPPRPPLSSPPIQPTPASAHMPRSSSKSTARASGGPAEAWGPRPRVASFFTGIGGFDLGFMRAGFDVVYQCEVDPYCRDVLKTKWPDLPNAARCEDIKNVASQPVPHADVWCAGFPCQDLSLADPRGRDGLAGERSGLFYEFATHLAAARPQVVLLENVPGLFSSHDGRDFARVLVALAQLGYSVGWRVLNSRHFGVPQWRQRLYIVGHLGGPERVAEVLFEPERGDGHLEAGTKARSTSVSPFMRSAGKTCEGAVVPENSFCLSASTGRHTGSDWSRTYVSYPAAGKVRRMTPTECERLQGFPDGWTIPGRLIESSDRIESKRYFALGNAVTVPVVEWLAERIKRALEQQQSEPRRATG